MVINTHCKWATSSWDLDNLFLSTNDLRQDCEEKGVPGSDDMLQIMWSNAWQLMWRHCHLFALGNVHNVGAIWCCSDKLNGLSPVLRLSLQKVTCIVSWCCLCQLLLLLVPPPLRKMKKVKTMILSDLPVFGNASSVFDTVLGSLWSFSHSVEFNQHTKMSNVQFGYFSYKKPMKLVAIFMCLWLVI